MTKQGMQGTYRITAIHISAGDTADFHVDMGGDDVIVMAARQQALAAQDAKATHVTLDEGGNVTGHTVDAMPQQTWKMDFNGPRVMLPLTIKGAPAGEINVVFSNAGSASVMADSDGRKNSGDVTYKGTHWYVSTAVHARYSWGETTEQPEVWHLHQFSDARPQTYPPKTIAPTYRAAIVAAITEAVTAFVTENPGVLIAAERNNLQRQLTAAHKEETAALALLDTARSAVSDLETALAELDEQERTAS